MPIDARLAFIHPSDGSPRLVFGDDGGASSAPSADLEVDAAFLDDMPASVWMLWDANVSRGERHAPTLRWERGVPTAGSASSSWQGAEKTSSRASLVSQPGASVSSPTNLKWQDSDRLNRTAGVGWQVGQGLRSNALSLYQDAAPLRQIVAWTTQHGFPVRHLDLAVWQEALRLRSLGSVSWQEAETMKWSTLLTYSRTAQPSGRRVALRWEEAVRPQPGVSEYSPPVEPTEPCFDPATLGRLEFESGLAIDGALVFMCGVSPENGPAIVIPILRRYYVYNDVTLTRAADGAAIRAESVAVGTDYRSWTWQFRANVDMRQAHMVQPDTELVASINGTEFRVVVTSLDRLREGASGRTLSLTGLGHSAVLEAPFSYARLHSNSAPRSMNQLMEDALTVNGVPVGYSVVSGIEDWTVPAGAFAHYGTPMSALIRLAKSAGAYVLSHPSEDTLYVLPEYALLPWDWPAAAADFSLPANVTSREGVRSVKKPVFNRVFVEGDGEGGVAVNLKRAGTDGGLVASPMIVDSLITSASAGRQRGAPVLANTGSQKEVSLKFPVLASAGIVLPGKMVEYNDGSEVLKGVVRSVSVTSEFPEVWQTVGVEVHDA